MKQVKINPDGWEVKIESCPPGFFMYENQLCFKTEYRQENGDIEVYCDSGETFMSREVLVQPVNYTIDEEQE